MNEIDLHGFYSQNLPETKAKNEAIINRLDSSYVFLKDEYVLKNLELKHKITQVYTDYKNYCNTNGIVYIHNKIDFNKKLEDIGINFNIKDGYKIYKVSHEILQQIATKNKWLHKLDEYTTEKTEEEKIEISLHLDYTPKDDEIKQLKEQIRILQEENQKLKEQQQKQKPEKKNKTNEKPKTKSKIVQLNDNLSEELNDDFDDVFNVIQTL